MRRFGLYFLSLMPVLSPLRALADPLDYDSYTRQNPRDFWMSRGDLGWLVLDYGLFAISVILVAWLLRRRPEAWRRLESALYAPFVAVKSRGAMAGGWSTLSGMSLYILHAMFVFLALAAWIFVCQWLRHIGLGAFSMAGLALIGLLLVRALSAPSGSS